MTGRDVTNYLEDLRTKPVCALWEELETARLHWWLQPACRIDGCLICNDLDPATQNCACDTECWWTEQ